MIWNGDMNWDLSRSSGFSKVMKNFVSEVGLVSLWSAYPVDHTHVHTDYSSTSVLDHFFVSERLLMLVEECRVLHRGDNMSRHSPILLKLRVGDIPTKKTVTSFVPGKPAWHKATEEIVGEYKANMQKRLEERPLPEALSCVDPQCGDPAHSQDRDSVI